MIAFTEHDIQNILFELKALKEFNDNRLHSGTIALFIDALDKILSKGKIIENAKSDKNS